VLPPRTPEDISSRPEVVDDVELIDGDFGEVIPIQVASLGYAAIVALLTLLYLTSTVPKKEQEETYGMRKKKWKMTTINPIFLVTNNDVFIELNGLLFYFLCYVIIHFHQRYCLVRLFTIIHRSAFDLVKRQPRMWVAGRFPHNVTVTVGVVDKRVNFFRHSILIHNKRPYHCIPLTYKINTYKHRIMSGFRKNLEYAKRKDMPNYKTILETWVY